MENPHQNGSHPVASQGDLVMRGTPLRIIWALVGLATLLSLLTLGLFPPLNQEEVGISSTANFSRNTGQIFSPIAKDVSHPHFEPFAGAVQDSLRGVHMALLGATQKVFGIGFKRERFLSFFIWFLIGVLLFFYVNGTFGLLHASLSVLIWGFALDGIMAGHLIRPDIWLALFVALVPCLMVRYRKKKQPLPLVLAGVLGGAGWGLHAHGLLLIPLILIFLFGHRKKGEPIGSFWWGWLLCGLSLGFFTAFWLADFPTFVLSQKGMLMGVFADRSLVWKERLFPHILLADSISPYLNPQSFYVNDKLTIPDLWRTAGIFTLVATLFSCVWVSIKGKQDPFLRTTLVGTCFVFFAVGYGHIRPAVLYNLPITIMVIPLLAWIFLRSVQELQEAFKRVLKQKQKRTFWVMSSLVMLGTIGWTWTFRYSLIYFLMLLLVTLALDKTRDRQTPP